MKTGPDVGDKTLLNALDRTFSVITKVPIKVKTNI